MALRKEDMQICESFHGFLGYSGGSVVKNLPAKAGDPGFDPWVGKFPWRRKWQLTPVFLPGKSQEQRSLAGYSRWGRKMSNVNIKMTSPPNKRDFNTWSRVPLVAHQ